MRCADCGTVLGPSEKFCGKCGAPRPQLEARFVEAQRRFTELSARHEAGQVERGDVVRTRLGDYGWVGPIGGSGGTFDGGVVAGGVVAGG